MPRRIVRSHLPLGRALSIALALALTLGTTLGLQGCGGLDPGSAHGSSNTIEQADALEIGARNACQAIERLRPRWLRVRSARSFEETTGIVVFLDDDMLGDLSELRDIPVEVFSAIQWLDSAEAGRLPGLGSVHVEGAILVLTGGQDFRE